MQRQSGITRGKIFAFSFQSYLFSENKLLADYFKSEIYARIYANRITLRLVRKNTILERFSVPPFTSRRLLVGDFTTAEKLLAGSVKELVGRRWFALSPSILVHPVEMVEGGLSQVEERVFLELGYGARGRNVRVYVGPELNDRAVIEMLAER